MSVSPVTKGLLWKETRQLFPLFAIVLVIGVACLFCGILFAVVEPQLRGFAAIVVQMLPALFAVGAAALLVGQEKEQHTLDWLAMLPGGALQLIGIKFLVALSGWLLIWLVAAPLGILIGNHQPGPLTALTRGSLFDVGVPSLILQSLVILVCGFYAAWRTSGVFSALALLVPLACGPFLIMHVVTAVYSVLSGQRIMASGTAAIWMTAVSVVYLLFFLGLSIRAARRALGPQPAPQRPSAPEWWMAWRPTAGPPPERPLQFPLGALVWQTLRHQRLLVAAILAALLCGAICLAAVGHSALRQSTWPSSITSLLMLGIVLASLAVSWLGVLTFAGDGSPAQLRFLGDRGVSPGRVWWGRQLVPLCLLSLALLAYGVLCWWVVATSERFSAALSLATVACAAWSIYSCSQWISQSLPMLAGAVVVAPLFALVVTAWGIVAVTRFGCPLWLWLLCSLVPLLATWLMMRRVMDGQRGGWFLAVAVLVVVLITVLPVTPFLLDVVTTPEISDPRKQQLVAAAEAIGPVPPPRRIQLVGRPERSTLFMTATELLQLYEDDDGGPGKRLGGEPAARASSDPVSLGPYDLAGVLQEASLALVTVQSAQHAEGSPARLAAWINALVELAAHVRQSPILSDQTSADVLEIWLLDALRDPRVRDIEGLDLAAARKLLSDQQGRSEARRRAVLVSWRQSQTWQPNTESSGRMPTLGGIVPRDSMQDTPVPLGLTRYQRKLNRVASALLELIAAGSAGRSTQSSRDELQELIDGIDWESDQGPYSDQYRRRLPRILLYDSRLQSHLFSPLPIGCLWYAPWETQARELAMELGEQRSLPIGDEP